MNFMAQHKYDKDLVRNAATPSCSSRVDVVQHIKMTRKAISYCGASIRCRIPEMVSWRKLKPSWDLRGN
jgi:hypothetical protein